MVVINLKPLVCPRIIRSTHLAHIALLCEHLCVLVQCDVVSTLEVAVASFVRFVVLAHIVLHVRVVALPALNSVMPWLPTLARLVLR